ncbi:helix-turn-helix domain-containing protein [Burkholderia contaminans]|nr:helix-turn-helix domain-containing protein [Burkholderia contaminans]
MEAAIEQRPMPWRAAEWLGISRQQIERPVALYRAAGSAALVSQRRGDASNHQLVRRSGASSLEPDSGIYVRTSD